MLLSSLTSIVPQECRYSAYVSIRVHVFALSYSVRLTTTEIVYLLYPLSLTLSQTHTMCVCVRVEELTDASHLNLITHLLY